jgi:uncharacterized OB-fold protein
MMKEAEYRKPLPQPTHEDAPFWEALTAHRFILPRCTRCGEVWFPPYLNCPDCWTPTREWFEASGTGEVVGVTRFEKAYLQSFVDDLPYNVCLIRLNEGPYMYSNLRNIPNGEIRVGLRVGILFDDVTPEWTLPLFAPLH